MVFSYPLFLGFFGLRIEKNVRWLQDVFPSGSVFLAVSISMAIPISISPGQQSKTAVCSLAVTSCWHLFGLLEKAPSPGPTPFL